MARRRGFFAELEHQSEVAAREQAKAIREAERVQKANERAAAQRERANAADLKRLDKEAQAAHVATMVAEAESQNSELSHVYAVIDSLLAATLGVDDYVDLTTLHAVAEHPPFDRTDLETPIPEPSPMPDPAKPVFMPPPAPKGILGMLGRKKHEAAVVEATAGHEQALIEWQSALVQAASARQAEAKQNTEREAERVAALKIERERYAAECAVREAACAARNDALDSLNANLSYGTADAVEEYVSIVFSNSAYPGQFPVEHDFEFDPGAAELRLRVLVPGPDKVPTVGAYKYMKSSDEITSSSLSQKASKDRYSGAVTQVALRSLHEVFEADRRGLIKTISLEVGTETIDPATGLEGYIPFVAAGVERDSFLALDLSNVVPAATLTHLGAAVSKNPYELVAANTSGIRRA